MIIYVVRELLSTQTNNILGHELDSNKIKQLKIDRKIQKDLAL